MARKRTFGEVSKLPSGRYRARYTGPDGQRHKAPRTFQTKGDADTWLTLRESEVIRDEWTPRQQTRSPFGEYAREWIAHRELKPTTRQHYEKLLDRQILPTFESVPLRQITAAMVRNWHSGLDASTPTLRAHAYGLLRTILTTAMQDEEISTNPAHIRGAGNSKRVVKIVPATYDEVDTLLDAMPERYKAGVTIAVWCGLRFGELTELRRKDVDLTKGVIRVRRAVTKVGSEFIVGEPKSDAGIRDVAIPTDEIPPIRRHLKNHVGKSHEALLFPSANDSDKHLAPSSLYKVFYPAREAAGRPDLRWHDLRHTGAVLAAQTGATLADLKARYGHSTDQAAMIYQHAAQGRDAEIAAKMSAMKKAAASR